MRACAEGPGCSDGIQNNGEEYLDCGGPCRPCDEVYDVPRYFKLSGYRTWAESKAACQSQGGSLATISNSWQHMQATKVCNGICWIGMYREQGCNDFTCWKWEDGQRYSETMYNFFGCCHAPVWPYGPTNTAVRLYPLAVNVSNWVASVPTEASEALCARVR